MSKYLAIIDLPDDSKCDGCTLLSEDCCRESGHWFRGWNYDRPTDCPLIPVERVIGSVFHLDASVQYGVSTDDVASMLRDELGVTE